MFSSALVRVWPTGETDEGTEEKKAVIVLLSVTSFIVHYRRSFNSKQHLQTISVKLF